MRAICVKAATLKEFETPERCSILELWNRDEDPGLSVSRARVRPGVTTELHRLTVDERYLVVEGTGRVEVEGMQPESVGAGDLVAIPANAAQRITNTGASDLIFYCLCSPRFFPESYRQAT